MASRAPVPSSAICAQAAMKRSARARSVQGGASQ